VTAVPGEGDKAPDFTLPDAAGNAVALSDFRGRKVVLYFYPKDDTPGCTTEACGFRDANDRIASRNALVVGVSPDPAESHRRFVERLGLPFLLLSDPDHAVAEAYGAWGEKMLRGKATVGILRSTFIIDEQGRIARVFRKVTPDGHAEEVLAAL
jgi:thioredoxin-dependent peroxiredoxin